MQWNPEEWIREGHGFTADSYRCRDDEALLLKLFFTSDGEALADLEFTRAQAVAALGIPTPKVYEKVFVNGCAGILYERIQNKKSFGVLCSEQPERLPEYAALFADRSRKLHETLCATDRFPDRRTVLRAAVDRAEISEEIRKWLYALLDALDDTHTCLHGDLQTGNLVTGWCRGYEGRDRLPGEPDHCYFIDLSTFSYGDPVLDISELYLSTKIYHNEESNIRLLHLTPDMAQQFWTHYAPAYIRSGESAELEAFEARAARYAVFFVLQILEAADGNRPVAETAMKHICRLYERYA